MKIERIELSVFETTTNTGLFELHEGTRPDGQRRWLRRGHSRPTRELHVLHVLTDDGIEGLCTVGDARYTTMRTEDLEQLRLLVVGEDPLERERLYNKCKAATRGLFTLVGWHGAFDNCLWDIAGKAAGLPVAELIGRVRDACPAYYNYGGSSVEAAIDDARQAMARGFSALKDHFSGPGPENESWFAAVRGELGDDVDLLHDAASCDYGYDEALLVAEALHDLRFGWFEEPLDDRNLLGLQRLCAETQVPILACETLMNDVDLSAAWLLAGATDKLRVNGRIGTTAYLQLAQLAQQRGTTVEPNGPGGLFGHVHAHLCCAVENTAYYEYFPGGSRDEVGSEIGIDNAPVPVDGQIAPNDGAGWGVEIDRERFESVRVEVR